MKKAAEAVKIQEAKRLSNAAQEFTPTAATATEVIPGNPSHEQTHTLMSFRLILCAHWQRVCSGCCLFSRGLGSQGSRRA